MHRFIITIDPKYEEKLTKIATITWKSSIDKGLYFIRSNNDIKFLKSLLYVIDVETERKGNLC